MANTVLVAPHPNPLPAAAGRGGVFLRHALMIGQRFMKKPFKPGRRAALGASLALGTAAATLPSATARAQRFRTLERAPLGNTAEEKRILAVIEDVYRNHRYLSVPEEDGGLLRMIWESLGANGVGDVGDS